jgi:AcrR family transcriptional regulator
MTMPATARTAVAPPHPDWRVYEPLLLTPMLAAALEVFQERGFHGTGVRAIVDRVGQTLPTLYHHHGSKEGVFVALCDQAIADLTWRVRAAAADADSTALAFANVIEAIVGFMTHRHALAGLDHEVRHLSPSARRRYARQRKVIETILDDIVERGVRERVFRADDAIVTTRALLGMCQAIGQWYRSDGPLAPDVVADQYVAIALLAVGAETIISRPEGSR